jgi:hypothetical protein
VEGMYIFVLGVDCKFLTGCSSQYFSISSDHAAFLCVTG